MLYALPTTGPINWSSNQLKSITHHPSPLIPGVFQTKSALTLADQVRQRYLQFLWLPDAIVPLVQLVPLLLLLAPSAPSTTSEHPLHAALDEVILTERLCAHKYRYLIPKWVDESTTIISSSTAGDLEAEMACFAFAHYAGDEDEGYGETQEEQDEASTLRWIKEMEKREVQLQILLYLLKLSLPGPTPEPPQKPLPAVSPASSQSANTTRHDRLLMPHLLLKTRSTANGRRTRPRPSSSSDSEEQAPRQILEDRLEGLMDRLAVWQMALPAEAESESNMKTQREDKVKEIRDWTQAFCEDVVRVLFAEKLPGLYHLLRTKLFRLPQWSSEGEDTDVGEPGPSKVKSRPRSKSAQAREDSNFFASSSTSNASGHPHPSRSNSLTRTNTLSRTSALSRTSTLSRTNSTLSRTDSNSLTRAKSTLQTHTTTNLSSSSASNHESRTLSRSRSRSLSLSLEAEAKAKAQAAASKARKRPLQREISMSRVFRPKSIDPVDQHVSKRVKREDNDPPLLAERNKETKNGIVLVEATPVKSVRQGREYGTAGAGAGVGGNKVLVQGTPVKKDRSRGSTSGVRRQSQMLVEEDEGDVTDEEEE